MRTYVGSFIYISILILFSSCSGSSGGFAPGGVVSEVPVSPTPTPSPPSTVTNNNVYYSQAQQVTTTNGWVLDVDQTNPVQSMTLSNAWKVEVRYE